MGLDELGPFEAEKRIIEYMLRDAGQEKLVSMSLKAFMEETHSESPAPGGGSIAAYVGSLGVALGGMVANLSSHKRGWDARWKEFSDVAEAAVKLEKELLYLVDEDTRAFNRIMDAFGLPNSSADEKEARKKAIQTATLHAIETPLRVMQLSYDSFDVIEAMAQKGNPNSVSDAGVGALCARTAVMGAWLNVKINCSGYDDKEYVARVLADASELVQKTNEREAAVLEQVHTVIGV
jgi:glutamate formiminotransferase/formiminotetrahydrofolate cyclodeaminase